MEKVSVIIPIYNTGEYLRPCIASICNQCYRNLQIIMVDDGSKKATADLCDEIAASDSRIIVLHKKNEGVSVARNVGLDIADGDVVCFVDSDDTIEPDMIATLVEALEINDAQIAMCDAVTVRPGQPDEADTINDFPDSCMIERKDIAPATLTRITGSACRCAYRRSDTLLSKQVRFPERVKFSEDRIFNIIAMSAAERIAYIKHPFYNRLIRSGSACFRYYPDMTDQIAQMRDVLINAVEDNWGEKYIEAYETQIAGQIRYAVTNYTSPENGESYGSMISKLKSLCENAGIKDCLTSADANDLRSRMILRNQYYRLFLIGRLTNYYHKLCKIGQYQA